MWTFRKVNIRWICWWQPWWESSRLIRTGGFHRFLRFLRCTLTAKNKYCSGKASFKPSLTCLQSNNTFQPSPFCHLVVWSLLCIQFVDICQQVRRKDVPLYHYMSVLSLLFLHVYKIFMSFIRGLPNHMPWKIMG